MYTILELYHENKYRLPFDVRFGSDIFTVISIEPQSSKRNYNFGINSQYGMANNGMVITIYSPSSGDQSFCDFSGWFRIIQSKKYYPIVYRTHRLMVSDNVVASEQEAMEWCALNKVKFLSIFKERETLIEEE